MSTVEEAYSRGQEPSQGNTSPTAQEKGQEEQVLREEEDQCVEEEGRHQQAFAG